MQETALVRDLSGELTPVHYVRETKQQRARKRATQSRLRAMLRYVDKNGHGLYKVWNLTKHVVYTVWWNNHEGWYECTCKANNLAVRCKHVQRVMDREEKRVKLEALKDEQEAEEGSTAHI